MSDIQALITEHLAIWMGADNDKKSGRGRASGSAASVYGVKKLRELILELAVRGKLVPQDVSDEPASELLKRIEAEKVILIKEGKIRKSKPLAAINDDEKTFQPPSGWEWVRFGDIGDWGAGATPLRSVSSYYGGEIPWFKSGELSADFIDTSEETITERALKECSLRLNQPDDVLIAMYGATIGKTSILKVQGTTNQAVCACTPNTGIFNRYLLTLLKAMKQNFIGQGTGGAQPNISREKIIATPFALPSTLEQHRIVAKVDELMTLCDQLENQHSNAIVAHEKLVSYLLNTLTQTPVRPELVEGLSGSTGSPRTDDFAESWQRIAANFDTLFNTESSIDALKQKVLQLAVMGKLVPQDTNDEPASELLKRIQAEKAKLIAEGKIKKDKQLAVIADDEKPFELPKGWEWARMMDCSKLITDGEHLTPQRTNDISQIPLVTAKNVRDGSMDYTITDFVDLDVAKKCWNRCKPELNDILIVSVGATIGRLTIIKDHRDMVIVRSVTLVKPLLVDIPYLAMTLRSPLLQGSIWGGVKQNAQPCLYLSVSNSLPIPLPPLAEQHRIVAKVDELMAICDQLKTRITTANQLQQKLADVLVGQAVA